MQREENIRMFTMSIWVLPRRKYAMLCLTNRPTRRNNRSGQHLVLSDTNNIYDGECNIVVSKFEKLKLKNL
jgi:hypothetical protein